MKVLSLVGKFEAVARSGYALAKEQHLQTSLLSLRFKSFYCLLKAKPALTMPLSNKPQQATDKYSTTKKITNNQKVSQPWEQAKIMPIDDNRSHFKNRSLEINCTKCLQKVPNYFFFYLNSLISCAIEMMFMSVRKVVIAFRQSDEVSVYIKKCMYVKIMHKTRQLIKQHLRNK